MHEWFVKPRGLLLVLAAAGAIPGCGPRQPAVLSVSPGGSASRDSVLALGRRQSYDSNPGAAARGSLEDGIEVTIQPMEDAFATDPGKLAQGVVLARLVNHGDAPLERLGLAPGATSYWMIYQKGKDLFSDFVADAGDGKYDRYGVPTELHPSERRWRQSIAQWQLPGPVEGLRAGIMAATYHPWVTCSPAGCCKAGN